MQMQKRYYTFKNTYLHVNTTTYTGCFIWILIKVTWISKSLSISALLYKPYGLKEYQLSKNIYLRGLWTVNVCLTNKENKTVKGKISDMKIQKNTRLILRISSWGNSCIKYLIYVWDCNATNSHKFSSLQKTLIKFEFCEKK